MISKYGLLLCIVLVGCGIPPDLTNDEIILESKKCTEAGMDFNLAYFGYPEQGHVSKVICVQKKKEQEK
jgi:hypothetical protein